MTWTPFAWHLCKQRTNRKQTRDFGGDLLNQLHSGLLPGGGKATEADGGFGKLNVKPVARMWPATPMGNSPFILFGISIGGPNNLDIVLQIVWELGKSE